MLMWLLTSAAALALLSTPLHVRHVNAAAVEMMQRENQGIVFEQVSEVLNFPTSPRVVRCLVSRNH